MMRKRVRSRSSKSASPNGPASERVSYETIIYEVDAADRVATITLNRPEVLNAFNRRMCHEIRDAWHQIKDDSGVHAVVLRAAGDRAFCAGLDVPRAYGQPDDVWNHEDPGEFLSPKWQKVWKPVVCAVQGICTAGALYFLNESDIVICSEDATFFDSHVTFGLVSAIEPVGLMRRIGLAETLRIALSGNDERVSADTALRISLVTEVVDRATTLGSTHTRSRAPSPRSPLPRRKVPSARSGSRSTSRTAPRLEQGLAYTRIGNPIGSAEIDRTGMPSTTPRIR